MSKKKLLEEAQVRRMFQLAGQPAIGESFISNRFSKFNEEEEDEAPVDDAAAEDPMAAGEEDPLAADAEAPVEEVPAAGGEIPQDKVEAIVDAVLAGIEEETGVPLERVPGEGEEAAVPGEEAPVEDPMAGGEEEIAAAAGEEEAVEEDPMAMERRVVNEVARRVARRLVRMSRKN